MTDTLVSSLYRPPTTAPSAMSDSAPATPTQRPPPPPMHSQANPIDLTNDDSDSDSPTRCDRKFKRTCSASRAFNASKDDVPSLSAPRFPPFHSGLSPAMSSSSLQPDNHPMTPNFQMSCAFSPMGPPQTPSAMTGTLRPAFAGPSTSAAFFPKKPQNDRLGAIPVSSPQPHIPSHSSMSPGPLRPGPPMQSNSHGHPARQVIDLTSSPSPPPIAGPSSQHLQVQPALSEDLAPKTPVCIGQLTVTALVLYPVRYVEPQSGPQSADAEWAMVRLQYEHTPSRQGNPETIHIRTPTYQDPNGEIIPGENFGVVEQKVANYLGPMLGKGLIRLCAKVRRGPPNVSTYLIRELCHS